MLGGIERAGRLPAGQDELKGADEALAVVGFDGRRRLRVKPRQFGVQGGATLGGKARFNAGAVCRIGGGQVVNAGVEGVVIEHGAADQYRDFATGVRGGDFAAGIGGKAPGGVGFFGVKDVYQRVRVAGQGGSIRLCRANIHAAVDLRGIDADEMHGVAVGEGESERGFAGSGRADEADDGAQGCFSYGMAG